MKNFINFLTKSTLVVLAVFGISAAANAQTVLWGEGSSDPAIDSIGRFASADGTLSSLGWVNNTVTACGGAWLWSADAISQGPYATAGAVTVNSPSIGDGVAFFDSDYYFGQGCAPQEATLTSPAIDLSNYTDSTVRIQFYAGLRDYQSDNNDIEFSVDGGTSWTSYNVIIGLGAEAEDTLYFDITSALAGVTTLTDCRIRLFFKGDSYYYGVDDISIQTFIPPPPAYDLAFVSAIPSLSYGDLQTAIDVGNYRNIPLNQVDVSQFYFGARIGNPGDINIYPTENPELQLNIEWDSAGTWTSVYADTLELDTLIAGVGIDGLYAEDITDISWILEGDYRVTYTLALDSTDSDLTNNTIEKLFSVTDDYYSKVDYDPSVDGPAVTYIWSGGADSTHSEWGWGSMYYFPTGTTGTTDSVILDSVSFFYQVPNPSPGDQIFNVKVYKFNDANADGAIDELGTELDFIGIGIDSVTGAASGNYNAKVGIQDFSGGRFSITAGDIYVVTINQGLSTGVNYPLGFEAEDYWMSQFYADAAAPAWTSIVNNVSGAVQDWNDIGRYFGSLDAMGVPSIGLHIGRDMPVSVDRLEADAFDVEAFPNPTSDDINVKVSLKEVTNLKYILTSINGSVIDMVISKNVSEEVRTFDTSKLPAGIYTLSIVAENGEVVNKRIVKK